MTQQAYEVFEHTADVGLHAYGSTLAELFIHAAQGMESLMVAPEQIQPRETCTIEADGHDTISLLIAWLGELVILFDVDYLLFNRFEVLFLTETHLVASAFGEPYDRERHDMSSAIKAVTWHEASVEKLAEGYKARIIFDI